MSTTNNRAPSYALTELDLAAAMATYWTNMASSGDPNVWAGWRPHPARPARAAARSGREAAPPPPPAGCHRRFRPLPRGAALNLSAIPAAAAARHRNRPGPPGALPRPWRSLSRVVFLRCCCAGAAGACRPFAAPRPGQ
jgi:hypothetical protein